jgi:hypothetical protein
MLITWCAIGVWLSMINRVYSSAGHNRAEATLAARAMMGMKS